MTTGNETSNEITVSNNNNNNQSVIINENEISDDSKVWGDITISDIKESNIGNSNREVLLAKYSQKQIKDIDANISGNKLKECINLAIFESGFKTENISELILLIIKDIFADFSYMTLSEVSLAFRKGIRGDLGEYMGLSVRTFYTWLKTYNQIIKSEAIKSLQSIKKEEVKYNEDERKEYYKRWLQSHIDDFKRHRNGEEIKIYDFGHIFYDYCIKHSIGYLTNLEKEALYDKARTNTIRKHSSVNAKSAFEIKEFRDIITAISTNNINPNIEDIINSEMKRLSIIKIFDKLIHQGLELENFINEIENNNEYS
jgi:hypothetical protein